MTISPFKTIEEDLQGELEDRALMSEKTIPFGVSILDDAMFGISPQDVVVIAGRSGQGKSELALQISLSCVLKGLRVCHIALEAESREISRRLLFKQLVKRFYEDPMRINLKPKYINWIEYKQEAFLMKYYEQAKKDLCNLDKLKIVYRGKQFGMRELSQVFVSLKDDTDLIILDHLHYMDLMDEKENRAYTDMIKQIRDLALHYKKPVVVVAHVRKADPRTKSPVPDMEDIHGSSDIYKVATKVITMAPAKDQRATMGTENTRFPTYLKIAKCRRDGTLQFLTGLLSFDITKSAYDDEYIVGRFDFEGEFVALDVPPDWAGRNKKVKQWS